jgi:hypothetical protein
MSGNIHATACIEAGVITSTSARERTSASSALSEKKATSPMVCVSVIASRSMPWFTFAML